jgi:hypothetical protein
MSDLAEHPEQTVSVQPIVIILISGNRSEDNDYSDDPALHEGTPISWLVVPVTLLSRPSVQAAQLLLFNIRRAYFLRPAERLFNWYRLAGWVHGLGPSASR